MRSTAMGQAGPDYDNLSFYHGEHPWYPADNDFRTLFAHHPEHGDVGRLTYRILDHAPGFGIPERAVHVTMLHVDSDHRRRGVASQLMNHLENHLFPDLPIDHGDRRPDGNEWAKSHYNDWQGGKEKAFTGEYTDARSAWTMRGKPINPETLRPRRMPRQKKEDLPRTASTYTVRLEHSRRDDSGQPSEEGPVLPPHLRPSGTSHVKVRVDPYDEEGNQRPWSEMDQEARNIAVQMTSAPGDMVTRADIIHMEAVQQPPDGLNFTSDDFETGGSKYPIRTHLRAHTPEDGQVGALIYYPPKRRNGQILIHNLHVEPDHRRRGIASALMDELQRRHPESSIDHGDRTYDGDEWWTGYTEGKPVRRGRTAAVEDPTKERWNPGETAHYEYHCLESPESSDAHLWYRSHQPVTVLHRNEGEPEAEHMTKEERGEEGIPWTYRVRFRDGHEGDAWEDELMTHPRHWYRPDPPKANDPFKGKWAARQVPHERLFGPTYGFDHRLWDGDKLREQVRADIINRWRDFCVVHQLRAWSNWVKIVFFGSEASEWTSKDLEGNGDFDLSVGIEYDRFRKANPTFTGMADQEIANWFTETMHAELNDSTHVFPDTAGTYDNTWFANLDGYDIRKIRPYAAYDVIAQDWIVKPPDLPNFNINELPHPVLVILRAAETTVRNTLKLPEPERTVQAARLYDMWHADRSNAFGPQGLGQYDLGNLREKWLDQLGLWGQLAKAHHDAASVTVPWDNGISGYLPRVASRTTKALDEIGRREHPNVEHYRSGGMGHLKGDDSRSVVGFMPTEFMKRYREHAGDWNGEHSQETVDKIRQDIREGVGIKTPLMVHYSDKYKWGYVGEGNHRLRAADEEGLQTVPVRVIRDDGESMRERWRNKHPGHDMDLGETKWTGGMGERYIPTDIHPYHFLKEGTQKVAAPWFDDGTVTRPRAKSVRRVGFAGFVADHTWHRDFRDSSKDADQPDYMDDHLAHFVRAHSEHPSTWDQHGEIKDINLDQPIYATQSHVSQFHIDRYRRNPSAKSWVAEEDPLFSDDYPGHYRPLFVTHQGRLHAIEGHHRVAADLQSGKPSVRAWHYDLDKHPIVNLHGNNCPECARYGPEQPPEQRSVASLGPSKELKFGSLTRAHSLFGKGLDAMFPVDEDGPKPSTTVPWPQVKKLKARKTFDERLVARSITHPEEFSIEQIDPRELHATQPSVTRGGVKHYMEGGLDYGKSQGDNRLGNDVPRVYHRLDDDHQFLLSGHHRAAAALLRGEPLHAMMIKGPWGPERNQ